MAKCKNCQYFYKRPDITMFTCAEGKPHEDNTVIDCDNYAPMTNADRIRSMTDEELARVLKKAFNCGGLIAMNQSSTECRGCKAGYCCNIDDWLKAESEE